jgi:Nucleoside-diphosphate-sugar pyrophosphorylase involved in lipopolysaccharide biosynthesis/translation initiation factor 2B, gamma/epsilon subunits (eIF-2Bgamma/eIF-2Bepsilon)
MSDKAKSNDFWRSCLLPIGSTMQQAIKCLDNSGLQIALVVDANERLIGTLTDGDIRRGLLRNMTIESPVASIVHRDAFVVPPELGRELVTQLMASNKIRQMPVVDHERHVVGLHLWDDLQTPARHSNLLVVMAGGKGTRLRPYTENCPKPLLPVAGKPMLEHIINRAKLEGFDRFVLAIHYLGHMIEDYFGDGSRWNVNIQYLREENPLGTAGALGLLESRPDKPIIVTNGDLITDFRFNELLEFHNYHKAAATMVVRLHEWQNPFGVVQTRGVDIVGLEEKPVSRCHINAGIYALEPRVLDLLGRGEYCDMPSLFARLQANGERTIVFPMHEAWLDIGRPNDLKAVRAKDGIPDQQTPDANKK